MLGSLPTFARYASALPGYLRRPLTAEACREGIQRRLRDRERSFLQILKRGIYESPRSPYRKLLEHAGITFGDMAAAIERQGLESTLEKLHDQGVYVTIDEFKGRRAIERNGLRLEVSPGDCDNPLLAHHYDTQTGGSRGARRRIRMDLDLVTHDAAYYHFFLHDFGLQDRPIAAWREVPPGSAGLNSALRYAKLGKPLHKWFSPGKPLAGMAGLAPFVFTRYTCYGARFCGVPIATPEYMPPSRAGVVARWLADARKTYGAPVLLDSGVSSGVLVCRAAQELGLDISGTFFRFGSEPYTAAKARVVAEAGCGAACNYHMTEAGVLGMTCRSGAVLGDVHLSIDKIAAIQRTKSLGDGAIHVGALVYTTLMPYCPKLMLNVESDDYGMLEDRPCGCSLGELGLTLHLHTIRSYEKLTAAGMTFLGTEVITLVEEVLPARFGGAPTDYKFVEEEENGATRVSVLVSPRAGTVDEQAVIRTVLQTLSACPGGGLMTEVWRNHGVLRVIRREPYTTGACKILPLHVLRKG